MPGNNESPKSEGDKQVDSINESMSDLSLSNASSTNEDDRRASLTKKKLIQILTTGNAATDRPKEHKFWDTQPVSKMTDIVDPNESGPIDVANDMAKVRKTPYALPDGFEWVELDIHNEDDREAVYTLLNENYVEDEDNMFRFDYKPEFLLWAISTPDYHKDWHIGVRVTTSKRLVGYITGIPTTISLTGKHVKVAEINFLCIHKKLRTKRLAPVLIKEVTRRVNLKDIWQAVYTAGVVLPKPISKCRYWHRPLDIKKLVEAKFSGIGNRMTMSRAIRLYRVSTEVEKTEMRPMEKKDLKSLFKVLNTYLERYKIHPVFTIEEVEHIFMPKTNVIYTYVKTSKNGNVTDMTSFYSLPSSVINNPKIATINAAYSYYHICTTMTYKQLIENAIIFAKANNFDVYNALDLMENKDILEDLKFGKGDGDLYYYLFNWKMPAVS